MRKSHSQNFIKLKDYFITFFVCLCLIAVVPADASAMEKFKARVADVLDADFLVIRHADGCLEKLWILGLTPPGPRHPKMPDGIYKAESVARAKQLMLGKEVYLKVYPALDKRDQFYKRRRRRAHVFPPDGESYAAVMVRDGYAWASFSGPMNSEMRAQLQDAQRQAMENHRGVYTNERHRQSTSIASNDVVQAFGAMAYLALCITVSIYSGVNACNI